MMHPRSIAGLAAGLSLIECLLAMTLFAVLTTMAWPLQTEIAMRLQRAQGRSALAKASWWLERQFAWVGSYPSALPMTVWMQEGLSYTLTLSVADGSYVLRATPYGRQALDACGVLWLNGLGQHGADQNSENCW
jgi:prepilin-type N-terminal cleavage/methylation domain-containing protein